MEKKQNSSTTTTCPLGPCQRLFNAFHINSTIPIIRRLTFRQPEPSSAVNNGRPPSPANTSPAIINGISNTQDKKPYHLQEKNEPHHVTPQINSHQEPTPMPVAGKLPPEQLKIIGPKTNSSAQVVKKKTLDPNLDKEENTSQATESKKNINEKVGDYINKTKFKMRAGSLGRGHTSSKG